MHKALHAIYIYEVYVKICTYIIFGIMYLYVRAFSNTNLASWKPPLYST